MIADNFKQFIKTNKLSFNDDSFGLFSDSLRCFHSGIYRPALIMAYQGMMLHFRTLIQNAIKPSNYDDGKWKGVIKAVNNDRTWDEQVFSACVQRSELTAVPPKVAILDMPDEIRDDFTFWRNRRNDCAHYKSYEINDAHVLTLYSFICQYLMRISVEGGMNSLLKEFKRWCDPQYTSPNTSPQPLVDKIQTMVAPSQYSEFFKLLESVLGFARTQKYYDVLRLILNGNQVEVKESLIKYIKDEILIEFIVHCSDLIGLVVDKTEARNIWYSKLYSERQRSAVLANMLLLGLIEESEIDEAISHILDSCYSHNDGFGLLSDKEANTLVLAGFFQKANERYIDKQLNNWDSRDCGRDHFNFFYSYMSYMPISKEYVKGLITMFSNHDYPNVWANIFCDNFMSNSEFKTQFEKVCKENSFTIPTPLMP